MDESDAAEKALSMSSKLPRRVAFAAVTNCVAMFAAVVLRAVVASRLQPASTACTRIWMSSR